MRRKVCVLVVFTFTCFVALPFTVWSQGPEGKKPKDEVKQGEEAMVLDPVVVTATRTETTLSKATKSVSVVTAKDRDETEDYFLPKLLADTPGVFFRRLGGPGQFSTISIRGAGSQYTQYQYNGFPLRDAADTSTTMTFFVEDLYSTSNLDRVEILRGTQSTLYGSQAMGGVINMMPKKWHQGLNAVLRTEVGKYDTFNGTGKITYGNERGYIDFSPVYVTTDGPKNGGQHGYYYDSRGFTGGAGLKFGPGMALEFSSMYSDGELAMGSTPELGPDGKPTVNLADKDKHREGLLSQYGFTFSHDATSSWDYTVRGAYTETERHYFWSDIAGNQSNYDGDNTYLETQHNIRATDWLTLVMGLDYEKSNYTGREPKNTYGGDYTPVHFDEDWYLWDLFCEGNFAFLDDSLLFSLGGRYNNHQNFDAKTVGEASAAYIFKQTGTKIRGSVGTGYRTPSLYEIYGGYLYNGHVVTVGNPDLEPETSTSFEVGIDQEFMNRKFTMGMTLFRTDFDNLIIYDGFIQKYNNATKAKTQGVEAYLNLSPWRWFSMSAAYTYADSEYEDFNTGKWAQKEYLPPHKFNATFSFFPIEGLTAWFRVAWQDKQVVPLYDSSWNKVRWEESSVTTVDAAVTYSFLNHFEVWLRADNLLNKDYTESGYQMPGTWVYGGIKLSF